MFKVFFSRTTMAQIVRLLIQAPLDSVDSELLNCYSRFSTGAPRRVQSSVKKHIGKIFTNLPLKRYNAKICELTMKASTYCQIRKSRSDERLALFFNIDSFSKLLF